MRFSLVVTFMVVLLSSCAGMQSAPVQVKSLELLDYGMINPNITTTINSPTTASGKHNIAGGSEFYKKTSEINAKKKATFGIKYQINGTPAGKSIALTYKVVHPPIKGRTLSSAKVRGTTGSWRADFYTFDEEYELVEGEWRMQIWYQNEMLLEKVFMVRKWI